MPALFLSEVRCLRLRLLPALFLGEVRCLRLRLLPALLGQYDRPVLPPAPAPATFPSIPTDLPAQRQIG